MAFYSTDFCEDNKEYALSSLVCSELNLWACAKRQILLQKIDSYLNMHWLVPWQTLIYKCIDSVTCMLLHFSGYVFLSSSVQCKLLNGSQPIGIL